MNRMHTDQWNVFDVYTERISSSSERMPKLVNVEGLDDDSWAAFLHGSDGLDFLDENIHDLVQ